MSNRIREIQEKWKEAACKATTLASDRCDQVNLPLTKRQEQIVQGAILNVLVKRVVEKTSHFVDGLIREELRFQELQETGTTELADLLIDRVWSTLGECEESTIVEAAAERLRLLDA